MPNVDPMSLKFNTKLDNTDFEKGTEEIRQALQSLRDTVSEISDELRSAFDLSEIQDTFNETAQTARQFASDIEDSASSFASFSGGENLDQMSSSLDDINDGLRRFSNNPDWDQADERWKNMGTLSGVVKKTAEDAFEGVKKAINDAGDAFQAFKDGVSAKAENIFKGMADAAQNAAYLMSHTFDDPVGALDRLAYAAGSAASNLVGGIAQNAGPAVSSAVGEIANVAGSAAGRLGDMASRIAPDVLRRFGDYAASAARNLASMVSNQLISDVKRLGSNIANTAKNLASMASKTIIGNLKKLGQQLTHTGLSGDKFGRQMKRSFSTVLRYAFGIRSTFQLVRKMRSAIMEGFGEIMKVDPDLKQTVDNMKKSLQELKMSFAATFLPLVKYVIPIITQIINALSRAIAYIGMFIAALTGQSTYKRAVAQQEQLADSADGAADSYNKAAKAAKEEKKTVASFDELHQLNDNSDSSSDDNKGSAYALVDMPIDSKIDDLAKKLKEMWDLADFTALGKKLGEGLKWLLEQIPWEKIKAVARKLGKSLATLLNGFLEVPGLFKLIGKTLAEAINTIFELLNAFVNNFHWDSLGKAIKDFVLGFLGGLDWPLIYDTFARFGQGIGEALEAALDNPEIWEAIFTTISHVVESLLLFIHNLFAVPDWASIARNIGEGLNKGVQEFPWSLLTDTIAVVINSLFDFLYNLITTFNFQALGEHVGQSITDLFTKINWNGIAATLAEGINALFEFIYGTVTNINWDLLGTTIKDFILTALGNIDWNLMYRTTLESGQGIGRAINEGIGDPELWATVFTTISNSARALLYHMYSVFTTPDFENIGKSIGDGLYTGVENFPWEMLGATLAAGLNMVIDLAYNFITTFDFYNFGHHIGESLMTAFERVDWGEFGGALSQALNALFDTLNGFLDAVEWKDIGHDVIAFIAGFFDELDVSKWGEFIGNIFTALLDFLSGAVEEIDWAQLPTTICNKIGEFLSGFNWEEFTDSAMKFLGEAIGAAMAFQASALTAIGGAFRKAFEDLIAGGLDGIVDGLKNIVTWLGDHVFTPIIDGFRTVFDMHSPSKAMGPLGIDLIAGLGDGIIEWIKGIPAWLAEHVGGPIIGGIMKLFGVGEGEPALKESGEGTIEGMKNGMVGALSNAFGWVRDNVGDKVLGSMKKVFGTENGNSTVTEGYGEQIAGGLKNGIKSNAGGMEKVAKDKLVTPVIDPMKSGFGISGNEAKKFTEMGTQITGSLQNSFSKGAAKIKDTASDLARSIISVFKDTKWADVGTSIIEPIAKAVTDGARKVLETFKELTSTIVSFFKSVNWGELGEFLIGSIEKAIGNGAHEILESIRNLCDGIVNFFKEVDWGSLGEGVISGIAGAIANGVSAVIEAARNAANGIIETFQNSDWASAGSNVISSIHATISSGVGTLMDLAGEMANGMLDIFGGYNWEDIGSNVINGIWNGIQKGWSDLYNLVWDMAEDMWNAAKGALGIASPSKEFAWIGTMITEGLAGGIDDTQKAAVSSAVDLAEAVLDGANGVKPKVSMEPAIDGLDSVLSTFSDKVADSFTELISRIEAIAAGSSFYVPGVAAGSVVPYSARIGNTGGQDDVLVQILDRLTALGYSRLSRSDIQEILERVFREYMNISFYLDDEQVARHANAGNERISRRYSPVSGT